MTVTGYHEDKPRTVPPINTDPEVAHGDADALLMEAVHPDITAAYERLVNRCRWWARV